jgi:hypothetical protein
MQPVKSFFDKVKITALLFFTVLFFSVKTMAQTTTSSSKDYFAVESYYKVKWGFADEFIDLWKKNHYPLLKKALEHGDIISITASTPKFHSGEDTRWDFRVTVVFKNVQLAFDEGLVDPYKKELYPDQDAYTKAEQHRFELLISHWDVETGDLPLN